MCRDPVGCLRVVRTLFLPHLDQSTGRWLVIAKTASKAEFVSAGAHDGGHNRSKRRVGESALDGVLAVGRRAPAKDIQICNICSILQFAVSI